MSQWLLDTNVLLRFDQVNWSATRNVLVGDGREVAEVEFIVAPQSLYELWTVVTRPTTVNELGYSAERADRQVDTLLEHFDVLDDPPGIWRTWRQLCVDLAVMGKQALAAYVIGHELDGIVTFNGPDFRRFSIGVIAPN